MKTLDSGEACLSVLALENNVEGFVNEVLDRIDARAGLFIVDLIWVNVKFDAVCNSHSNDRKTISSFRGAKINAHPHALAQCRDFISQHNLIPTSASSNSQAVHDLREGELALRPHFDEFTTIANDENINVIADCTQDYDDAKTAFVLLSKHADAFCEANITGINHINRTFWQITPTHEDRPGTLLHILQLIDGQKINISSLNSRPLKENLDTQSNRRYSFYLILDANYDTTISALGALDEDNYSLRYLGGWNE